MRPEHSKSLNPMWIISLFLGLSEVTVGIAATQASGWVQGLLAVFAVAFPTLIATVFFVILWKRPYVLYAPKDFSETTNVKSYVDAMTVTQTNLNSIAPIMIETVQAAIAKLIPTTTPQSEVREEVEGAIQKASELVRTTFASIEFPGGQVTAFNTTHFKTLKELILSNITFRQELDLETYGLEWIIHNQTADFHYPNKGLLDSRLEHLDIFPGTSLQVKLRKG
jgi:hypothetical protein